MDCDKLEALSKLEGIDNVKVTLNGVEMTFKEMWVIMEKDVKHEQLKQKCKEIRKSKRNN